MELLMMFPWNVDISDDIHVLKNIKQQFEETKLCVLLKDVPSSPVKL